MAGDGKVRLRHVRRPRVHRAALGKFHKSVAKDEASVDVRFTLKELVFLSHPSISVGETIFSGDRLLTK